MRRFVRRGKGWADTHAAWRAGQALDTSTPALPYADVSKIPDGQRERTEEILENGTILTTWMDRPPAAPQQTREVSLVGVPGSGHEGNFDHTLPPNPAPPPAPASPKARPRPSAASERFQRFDDDQSPAP